MISYSNGAWIPSEQMAFPIVEDTVGTVRGFRIFTACKTIGGVIFRRQNHLDRLWDSAKQLGMQLPHSQSDLSVILDDIVKKNAGSGELLIEIFYSGGPASANGTSPIGPALLYVLVLPLKSPSQEVIENGIVLATFPFQRPFPEIKLTFYVGAVVAHHTVLPQFGADYPLFVCPTTGDILEGSTFNFFGVKDGVLITPELDGRILDGITRRAVIEIARANGLTVREQTVGSSTVFDEVFITSSTRNILPVNRINSTPIGGGIPGPVTRRLIPLMPKSA